MEDETEQQQTSDGPQNLNDLQSYLVHFNKEIGSNDGNSFQQKFISQMIAVTASENTTPSEEELPAITGEKSSEAEQMITEDLSEGQIPLSEVAGSKFEVIDEVEPDKFLSSDIPDLSANNISSLVDESHTSVEIETLQSIMNSGNVMMIPVSNASSVIAHDGQKLVQIVNVNGQPTLQVVNSEHTLQTSGEQQTDILPVHQTKSLIDVISNSQNSVPVSVIDGTDPVAVLASVAANTSTINQLQTVQLPQTDIRPAQLVALRNSANTAQPQLVAVQTDDGAVYGVTNVSQPTLAIPEPVSTPTLPAGAEATPVSATPALLAGGDVQLPGPGNYILIVNTSGEKDQRREYDFGENLRGEVVEEIIEADGTTKRLVKITQVSPNRQSPTTISAIPFGDQLMCSYCSYTSPKRYLLSRHMKSHSEDRPHKCSICQRGFKSMASLQNHINTHTGVRPHKCKSCDSAFTTSGELVRHIRYKHTFEKPHKCTECEYASVELSKLKRHIRMHTGERPYQCSHCNYASPDTYKLKRHMRIHTGEKPYQCDICHAKFTQSNSLKAHKLIHSGNKPVFQCDYCPTTCGRKTDLKIHIQKLHSSDTPQLCKKCGDTFPDRYHFKVHMKSHEGEKCFKCNLCDYAAGSLRHLETHLLTHSGEKPYECDECDMAFRQRQLLRRHKNLFHNTEYTPMDKEQECAACRRLYGSKKNTPDDGEHLEEDDSEAVADKDLEHTCGGQLRTINSLTADQLIENSLLADMKEGKLGASPKVVVVHPDGRIEEVTAKLQSLSQSKPVDDFLVSLGVTGDTQFDQVSHLPADLVVSSTGDASTATNEEFGSTTEDQSKIQLTEAENQSLHSVVHTGLSSGIHSTLATAENQSVQTVFQAEPIGDSLSFQTVSREDTNDLVIDQTDQKEAGTQAAFDSDPEDEKGQKIRLSHTQPQIIKITQVLSADSGPQTDMEDSTFIVTRGGDPDIKPIYVSILHDHQSSGGKAEDEVQAKRIKLMDSS